MAVQNKQPQARLSDYQLYPERFSKYTGNNVQLQPKAGTRFKQQDQHYSNYLNSYPSQYTNYPYYQTYPYYPNRGVQNSGHQPQSFSQVLDMLSRNDERQCVPRLLCEMLSNSNQSQDLKLPFNVNLDGLSG